METAKLRSPLRVGLLGTGFIGQVHSRMLRQIANLNQGVVRVTSVFSTDQESARKIASRWAEARCAESAQALIASAPYAIEDANFIAAVDGAIKPYAPLQAGVQAQALVESA
jgi:predicted dinucleotide-utilizing enzyme